MEPLHLDQFLEMANKFEQDKGHELGVKRIWKKKKDSPTNGVSVDEGVNPS